MGADIVRIEPREENPHPVFVLLQTLHIEGHDNVSVCRSNVPGTWHLNLGSFGGKVQLVVSEQFAQHLRRALNEAMGDDLGRPADG